MSKDDDENVDDDRVEMDTEDSCQNDQPLIKDFQMDPEYRKFVFSEEYDENGKNIKRAKSVNLRLKRRFRNEKKSNSKCSTSSINQGKWLHLIVYKSFFFISINLQVIRITN